VDKAIRVIILEDNPNDADLIQFELEDAGIVFTAAVVMDKKDYLHALENDSPDIILSDYDLPTYTGALALAEAKQKCPDVPFILVTGAVREERAIEILTSGAKDYVMKTGLHRLAPAIKRALAEADEHRARKQAEENLRKAKVDLEHLVEERTAQLQNELAERQQVEDTIREKENLYQSMFENMLDGFAYCRILFDERGNPIDFIYLAVNNMFRTITGLDNVVGKKVTDVLPGIRASNPELFEIYGRVARTGEPERFEIFLGPFNKWLYVSTYRTNPERFVAIFEDITDLKQAETSLKRNSDRLKIISQTASRLLESDKPQFLVEELYTQVMQFLDCDVFFNFLVDEGRGKLHLNAYAGIPEETAGKMEWLDYGVAVCGCAARDGCRIVAENIPETPDVRTELVKSFGIKAYACHPLMAKDLVIGTLSFGARSRNTFSAEDLDMMKDVANQVAIAIHRIRNEEALIATRSALEKVVRERTNELKNTLTHLEDEKRRFNEVLDVLSAYVILLTPDYHVAFENRFFRERFGESTGRRCFEFLFGRNEPCEICETYKTLDTMEPRQWEWTGPDGHVYDIYDYPFIDTDGSTLILEMGLDITDKKRIEMELETHRHHLEELVERRTSQLEEANRELESFSYSVSHDLRAPLRAIDGYSKMILKRQGDQFDAETRRQFDQVRNSTKEMGDLIEDLLDLSRLGRQELNLKIFDMSQLVEETWQELKRTVPDRRLALKMNNLPPGWGDRSLMKQVYVNLFSNAIKFTGKQDAAMIEAGGYENGNENVYYIKDNGVGFDMKYHDKMFGAFQRLHPAAEYEGTGIGLTIVQRIIHHHDGRVWAEGKLNEGAVFYFTLPKKDKQND